jgi:hypothetical protein
MQTDRIYLNGDENSLDFSVKGLSNDRHKLRLNCIIVDHDSTKNEFIGINMLNFIWTANDKADTTQVSNICLEASYDIIENIASKNNTESNENEKKINLENNFSMNNTNVVERTFQINKIYAIKLDSCILQKSDLTKQKDKKKRIDDFIATLKSCYLVKIYCDDIIICHKSKNRLVIIIFPQLQKQLKHFKYNISLKEDSISKITDANIIDSIYKNQKGHM